MTTDSNKTLPICLLKVEVDGNQVRGGPKIYWLIGVKED